MANPFKTDAFKQLLYYILIAIISLITTFFLPMVGSTIGLEWALPTSIVGWIVFSVVRLIIAVVNILIFYCFMQQAKVNVAENESYIAANNIMLKNRKKERLPRSPQRWNASQYGTKGVFIFLASIASTVALSQAVLTFDWVSMLTYLFSIVMAIIFGFIQMRNAEDYWTNEYYEYALYMQQKEQEEQKSELEEINDNSK